MAIFGNVDAHHEMLRRSAYLALQLTKPRKPAIIVLSMETSSLRVV